MNLKDERLPTIQTRTFTDVVRKMRRTAAPGVDGWTKGMLEYAIIDQPALADSWCALLTDILRGTFKTLVMQCLRAARLVGIPKQDGGVRPIAVSHFFLKMAGIAAIKEGGATCEQWQYAIGRKDGTKDIVHKLRDHKNKNHTILKFDLHNGFNEMPRALCEQVIQGMDAPHLKAYFRQVYYHDGDMAVYNAGSPALINATEGVRQGDATSSFFFCKALDHIVRDIIHNARGKGITVEGVYCFMDDVSFAATDAAQAVALAEVVINTFEKYKMRINMTSKKSAAMISTHDPHRSQETYDKFMAIGYTAADTDTPFGVLGAELSDNVVKFYETQQDKQLQFFLLLEKIDIHPAVLFTILRICGNPRLLYLCGVMPPSEHMRELSREFDRKVYDIMNGPNLLRGHLEITPLLYDINGAGFTKYEAKYAEIYQETIRRVTMTGKDAAGGG
jgi:hypothetical protein